MKTLTSVWMVAALIACLGAFGFLHSQKNEKEKVAAEMKLKADAVVRQQTALEEKLRAAEAEMRAAREKADAVCAEEAKVVAGMAAIAPARQVSLDGWKRNHPDFLPHRMREARRQVIKRYGPLFARLGLDPVRLEKMKTSLVEKEYANQDASDIIDASGVSLWSAEARRLGKSAQEKIDAEIRHLLGESDYIRYREYEQSAPKAGATEAFSSLQYEFNYKGIPELNSIQLEALAKAYDLVKPGYRPGPDYSRGSMSVDEDRRVRDMVSATLSPQQVKELEAMQVRVRAQRELFRAFLSKKEIKIPGF